LIASFTGDVREAPSISKPQRKTAFKFDPLEVLA